MKKLRILSGGIQQESHSFNPVLASRGQFHVSEGPAAVSEARNTNSTLGGVVDAADELGAEVIVPLMLRAQSGGPVEDAVFTEVRDRMVDAARRGDFDAIVLPLHGGMLTPSLFDPEGMLFRELRAVVGPSVPITAAFDLHAHVTPEALQMCNLLAGYWTNPHDDQGATGRRAFMAAADIVANRLDPVCAFAHLPMLTLGNDRTDESPLQEIHSRLATAVRQGEVVDASVFNAQQFLDVPGLGQMIIAYGNKEGGQAEALVRDLSSVLWGARDRLIGDYPTLQESFARLDAPERSGPLVLGDQGDRVAAGGPGDSTFVLAELLANYPDKRALVPIADPSAVEACLVAGPGSVVTVTVGGRVSQTTAPISLTGKVVSAGRDAAVTVQGPHDAGAKTSLGPYAVLETGNVQVALTTLPNAFTDPQYFRSMGADPALFDVVVTRSGYHFTLNFASLGECITIDTPGMTSYRIQELPFRLARPLYPLDDFDFTPKIQLIDRSVSRT